ncbi:hypothetical protein [Mesorhizobium marinum]|uniref:hypothetical protein n=1 Tax=Mesorhizobium marinum TaxID=3228790 RepID=UPI00346641E1
MRSREIQQFLSSITNRPLSDIDQRCRRLREEDIPSGPRGWSAPHMTKAQALMHVLALTSRRAVDSYQVLQLALDCRLVQHPEVLDLTEAFSMVDSLAGFMMISMDQDSMEAINNVGFRFISFEIADDGSHAFLNLERRSLKRLRFLFTTTPETDAIRLHTADAYNHFDAKVACSRFIIGAHHLKEIGSRVLDAHQRDDEIAEAAE